MTFLQCTGESLRSTPARFSIAWRARGSTSSDLTESSIKKTHETPRREFRFRTGPEIKWFLNQISDAIWTLLREQMYNLSYLHRFSFFWILKRKVILLDVVLKLMTMYPKYLISNLHVRSHLQFVKAESACRVARETVLWRFFIRNIFFSWYLVALNSLRRGTSH